MTNRMLAGLIGVLVSLVLGGWGLELEKRALTVPCGVTYLDPFPLKEPSRFKAVNVQITDINETRKTLTVTLDKGEVDAEYNTILGEFTKQVSLPGFRPGKAPAPMIANRFGNHLN